MSLTQEEEALYEKKMGGTKRRSKSSQRVAAQEPAASLPIDAPDQISDQRRRSQEENDNNTSLVIQDVKDETQMVVSKAHEIARTLAFAEEMAINSIPTLKEKYREEYRTMFNSLRVNTRVAFSAMEELEFSVEDILTLRPTPFGSSTRHLSGYQDEVAALPFQDTDFDV
jgi:hypothetical protein